MKKESTSLKKKPPRTPGATRPPNGESPEPREQLRELDTVNVDFGDEFYDRMHDQIMAKIEQQLPDTSSSESRVVRQKASALSLIQL